MIKNAMTVREINNIFGQLAMPRFISMMLLMINAVRAKKKMAKAKILITDDDQDIKDSVKAILESRKYDVVTAASRTEGMEKIESEKPDLLILDVMMSSWQDGFEMAREIKKDPQHKEIPILMMTGVKEETGLDFKSAAGDPTWCPVEGFLDKPVEPDTLIVEVEKLLPEKT